jgi:ABC-type siderophore export system fused ATPase/permease subunit
MASTRVPARARAGKSTLLHVLQGRVANTSGTILCNGRPERLERYKKLIGYVPQADIMHRDLTGTLLCSDRQTIIVWGVAHSPCTRVEICKSV